MPDSILTLRGTQLPGGWTVGDLLSDGPKGSGGNFSVCYNVVGKDGTKAFLKVLDSRKALAKPDVARALQDLTSVFNFERDILDLCNGMKLSKIVIARGHGEIKLDDHPLPFFFIVFELADGDVRSQLAIKSKKPFDWCYGIMHNVQSVCISYTRMAFFTKT